MPPDSATNRGAPSAVGRPATRRTRRPRRSPATTTKASPRTEGLNHRRCTVGCSGEEGFHDGRHAAGADRARSPCSPSWRSPSPSCSDDGPEYVVDDCTPGDREGRSVARIWDDDAARPDPPGRPGPDGARPQPVPHVGRDVDAWAATTRPPTATSSPRRRRPTIPTRRGSGDQLRRLPAAAVALRHGVRSARRRRAARCGDAFAVLSHRLRVDRGRLSRRARQPHRRRRHRVRARRRRAGGAALRRQRLHPGRTTPCSSPTRAP